jgi:hypothetical protein
MKFPAVIICFVLVLLAPLQAQTPPSPESSMEKKLRHVENNSTVAHPDPSPTEFTVEETNAYFAAGEVKLPIGVRSVHFESQPGVVTGTALVDFDQMKSGRNANHPLLSIFTGVHTVVVIAHAHGKDGEGFVHVDSVSIDGSEIPPFILQIFVQKFVQPKYPNVGIDSHFTLPARVDSAIVNLQKLTLIQK